MARQAAFWWWPARPALKPALKRAACADLAAWLLAWSPPSRAAVADDSSALTEQSRALQRAYQSVLGAQVVARDKARSSTTLRRLRSGSGVLIHADGLVLTIGYLVLEADQVQLVLDDGHAVPARVLGYDVATGFGLLQVMTARSAWPNCCRAGRG